MTTLVDLPADIVASLEALPASLRHQNLGDGVVLRHAHPDEFAEVGDVLELAFTTGCWVTPSYIAGLHRIADRSRASHVWVVADADGVLGAVLTPKPELHRGRRFTFNILGVGPRGRGRRLGQRLTDHAVSVARHYGYREVEIHSSPQMTAAHQVYYRYGFVRRIDWETAVVDSGQRLYSFTYRIPEPRHDTAVPDTEGNPVTIDLLQPLGAVDEVGLFQPTPPSRPGPFVIPSTGALRLEASWDSPRSVPSILATRLSSARQVAVVEATNGPRLYVDGVLLSDDWRQIPSAVVGAAPYPASLDPRETRADAVADQIWADVVEGLEQALFSSTNDARDAAQRGLYSRLGMLDLRLATSPYLVGDTLTVVDLALFGVVLGYDNGPRSRLGWGPATIVDYPHLWRWARRVFRTPGLVEQSDLVTLGLVADPSGAVRHAWGEPLPVEGVTDLLAAWQAPEG